MKPGQASPSHGSANHVSLINKSDPVIAVIVAEGRCGMTDNANAISITATELAKLTADFRSVLAKSHGNINGRVVIPAAQVEQYISRYCAMSGNISIAESPTIDISGLHIEGPFVFPPGGYPAMDVHNTIFDNKATFRDVIFHGKVDFKSIGDGSHNTEIIFRNVQFHDVANFDNANLYRASFKEGILFEGKASFKSAHCGEMEDITFKGYSDFSHAILGSIRKSIFLKGALFDQIDAGDLRITESVFHGSASFKSLKVSVLNLATVEFKSDALFTGSVISNDCAISGTRFLQWCDFSDCEFSGPILFSLNTFMQVPRFYKVTMYPDVSFHGPQFKCFKSIEDANAYAELRKLVPSQDGEFFAYEQRARANAMLKQKWGFSLTALVSKAYDYASGYGQSIVRPALGLLGTIILAWLIFSKTSLSNYIHASEGRAHWTQDMDAAFGLVLQNVFNPVAFWGKEPPFVSDLASVVYLSIVQTVLSLGFITLLLLAIRRKFRKGSE